MLLWVKNSGHHGCRKIGGVETCHSRRHGETNLVFGCKWMLMLPIKRKHLMQYFDAALLVQRKEKWTSTVCDGAGAHVKLVEVRRSVVLTMTVVSQLLMLPFRSCLYK